MSVIRSEIDACIDSLVDTFQDMLDSAEVKYMERDGTLTNVGKVALRIMMFNTYIRGIKEGRNKAKQDII